MPDALSFPELLNLAQEEAGGWEALASRVPWYRTAAGVQKRKVSLARIKQMYYNDVRRVPSDRVLLGLAGAGAFHAGDERFTRHRWAAAALESMRRHALADVAPVVEGDPLPPVRPFPAGRRRSRLQRQVEEWLAEHDTSGVSQEQVSTVLALLEHFTDRARHRKGA